jgi:hypothetical protein
MGTALPVGAGAALDLDLDSSESGGLNQAA